MLLYSRICGNKVKRELDATFAPLFMLFLWNRNVNILATIIVFLIVNKGKICLKLLKFFLFYICFI